MKYIGVISYRKFSIYNFLSPILLPFNLYMYNEQKQHHTFQRIKKQKIIDMNW